MVIVELKKKTEKRLPSFDRKNFKIKSNGRKKMKENTN